MTRAGQCRLLSVVLVVGFGILSVPAKAQADGFFTPFIGVNFGGSTSETLGTAVDDASQLGYGARIGFMGGGVIGFEEEFGYSPKFFAPVAGITDQTNVLTLMSNLVIGIPLGGQKGGGVRPYVIGGIGLLRTKVDDAISVLEPDLNGLGWDFGGGINGYFSDHVGINGDLRYYKGFTAPDSNTVLGTILNSNSLDFWRGSIGIVFRF